MEGVFQLKTPPALQADRKIVLHQFSWCSHLLQLLTFSGGLRRSQEVYIQEVCFPAMNCTPWTPPQWYGKLCIGKNGRSRAGWPPDKNMIPKVTLTLTPHRKKEQDLFALGECLFYMCPLSATQTIILWRQRPQNTADNRTQTTVNRYTPDLAEFQASPVDISLDYEFVSTSL